MDCTDICADKIKQTIENLGLGSDIVEKTLEQMTKLVSRFAISEREKAAMVLEKVSELMLGQEQIKANATTVVIEAMLKSSKATEEIALLKAKTDVEKNRKTLVLEQQKLVTRQSRNYNDAIFKKTAEYSGAYANFAVMAAPENAQGSLDLFKEDLNELRTLRDERKQGESG